MFRVKPLLLRSGRGARASFSTNNYGAKDRIHQFALVAAFATCFALTLHETHNKPQIRTALLEEEKKQLRTFTKEEVSKYTSESAGGIYVTHLDGVYDVTEFVKLHPGGNKIFLAAGTSVDPYWKTYKQHFKPFVLDLLNGMRIGTLSDYDPAHEIEVKNVFENEPVEERNPELPVYSSQPFCCGTLEEEIPKHYITPINLSYVRNNNPVPTVDVEEYRLHLGYGIVLSLEDLKQKFQPTELVVTMICTGNRRSELDRVLPVSGLKWKSDGVSTHKWKGVLLRDMRNLIVEQDGKPIEHVWFQGIDAPYDASVPVEKAFSDQGQVLIAYEMNGEPIPRDHGGPVRAVIPGHIGARSVKWLKQIKASDEESPSIWQRGAPYKVFGPYHTKLDKLNFDDFPSAQEMPVQSSICAYEWDSARQQLLVTGWAWSGGGRKILRVEVSKDGGKTWQEAKLGLGKDQPPSRAWAWTFWDCACDLSTSSQDKEIELVVRSCDQSFNVQPESTSATWNAHGILNNAYHRLHIINPLYQKEEERKT